MGYTSGFAATPCVSASAAADPGGVVAFARASETLSCRLPESEDRCELRGPALYRIDSRRAGPLHRQRSRPTPCRRPARGGGASGLV